MCLAETKNVGNTKYASTKNKTKTPNRPTHQVTALLSPPATSHCCSRRMLNPPGCRVRLRMCRRLPSPRDPPPRRYQVSCCPLRWPRSARAAACEQSQRQRQPQPQEESKSYFTNIKREIDHSLYLTKFQEFWELWMMNTTYFINHNITLSECSSPIIPYP